MPRQKVSRHTVQSVARLSGVSVRTLHYYDEIGLLKPAWVGANGYRYYERAELLRLQRILFHRELGVPLGDIGKLLEMEGDDQVGVLLRHREKLVALRERYAALIDTVDRTLASLTGDDVLPNADLYRGFSDETQAGHEAWLVTRYGEPMSAHIRRSRTARMRQSAASRDDAMKELRELEGALADAMRRAVAAEDEALEPVLARHRAWVAQMWGRPCAPEAYAGLADLYVSHPEFVARYERIAPGFAPFIAAAVRAHARRHGLHL